VEDGAHGPRTGVAADHVVAPAAARSIWRHENFRRLWLAQAASQLGFRVGGIAIPLLAVNMLSVTAFDMGLLNAAQTVGTVLVGLPAGAWVDRVRRRRLMIRMDLLRAALLLTLPLAWLLGSLSFGQLLVVAFTVGIASVFFDIAQQSYLPPLVGRTRLVEANSALQVSQSVATVSGPALGGGLVAVVGAGNALVATGVAFLGSAAWLHRVRAEDPTPAAPQRRHLFAEIGEGLRFVLRDGALRAIACCTATANLFMSVVVTLLVFFLAREVGLPPWAVGLVAAAGGVGGIAGALTARRWTVAFGRTRSIWLSLVLTQPFGLLLAHAYADWRLALFVVGWFALGYGGTVYNVVQTSFRQAVCPDELLGRVQASNRFFAWGSLPIGGLLGGVLATSVGTRGALTIAAVGLAASVLWLVVSPLPRYGRDGGSE
jgi:MFS family permease